MGSDEIHTIVNSKALRGNTLKILWGTAILTLVYGLSYYLATLFDFVPPPAIEFCNTDTDVVTSGDKCPTNRPDLFAFQMGSGLAIFYVSFLSVVAWYQFKQSGRLPGDTVEERIFGYHNYAQKIAIGNFIFQFWDFFISLFIREHCNTIMLCHHLFTAMTAWFCFQNQILLYYAVFYLGLSEISSIFLVVVDLGKYFPPPDGSWYHVVVEISKVGFAVMFIWLRVIMWFIVSFKMYLDIFEIFKKDDNSKGSFSRLRPGKQFILYYYLVGAIAFGLLQLYWTSTIANEIRIFFSY